MMASQGRVESNRGSLAGVAKVSLEVGASVGKGNGGNGERLLMALANEVNCNEMVDKFRVSALVVGGPFGKIIKFYFAPNIIFSVGSCICMLYDLTCQVLLKNPPTAKVMGYNVGIWCF